MDKIGQLQLIVMNLQIDLIRSLSSIREEVSLAVASPRMNKLYITISENMRRVGNELLKVFSSILTFLKIVGRLKVNCSIIFSSVSFKVSFCSLSENG